MKPFSFVFSAAIATALLASPTATRAQSRESVGEARAAYLAGNAAFEKQRWADAEAAYLRAWSLAHSFDVAGNLGEVEFRLGKHRDAARFLAYDLRSAPPSVKPEQRQRTEHFLAEARQRVATLRVHANAPGVEVRIDGQPLESHEVAEEVFVDAGPHTVAVSAAGYASPPPRQVTARAGGAEDLSFELQRMAGESGRGSPTWPIYVGLGATVVTAAIATGLTISSTGKASDADAALATHPGGCSAAGCADVLALRRSADSSGDVAFTMFVAAGTVGLGTLAYVLFRPKAAPAAATTGLVFTPLPLGGSLSARF